MNILEQQWLGTDLRDWALALALTLGCAAVLLATRSALVRRLERGSLKSESRLAAVATAVAGATQTAFLLLIAVYLGAQLLDLPQRTARLADSVATVALLLQVAVWGNRGVTWWVARSLENGREEDAMTSGSVAVLGFLARLGLWTVVLLVLLDNLGVNITALVASLGIGGIAVALAVQNVLGDILASLAIVLDRPFEAGDFIVVDDTLGTVEYIGVKTTRLRSLSGEQVVCSNADLLKCRIRNFKRMFERRVLFSFGVVYQTPPDLLERIPQMVRQIVESQAKTRFDRAHFNAFGDSALGFEVVYYVLDPDYATYMDTQQAINLALMRRFSEADIEFAYPTRTLLLRPESGMAAVAAGGNAS